MIHCDQGHLHGDGDEITLVFKPRGVSCKQPLKSIH